MVQITNLKKRLNSRLNNNKPDSLEWPEYQLPTVISDNWGMRFLYYPTDSESVEVVTTKDFYKSELLAIKKLIKKGDITVDIGANIGMFSVYLSLVVGDRGQVYAFEPVRDTYHRMLENLAINRCENVLPYRQAVSNKVGKSTMNIFPEGYGAWNTFGRPNFGEIKPVGKENVPTTTVEHFCRQNKISNIDFLKIDVEGYEKDVLEGAKRMLASNKIKYLSFEISEIPLKGAGRKGRDVFDFLKSFGYSAYEFNPETNKFTGPVLDSDAYYQNYYASKKDMTKL